MIRQDFSIEGYWKVTVLYNVWLGEYNSGFTQTDMYKRYSIIGIGKADSKAQFLNTVVHEAKHLQSNICEYYGVKENGEQAAYLIGYIIQKMYEKLAQLKIFY